MAAFEGSPSGDTLLAAYRKWKAQQENPPGATPWERSLSYGVAKAAADGTAARIAALAQAGKVEAKAHRKGVSTIAKAASQGASPTAALALGYRRYRRHGGSASLSTWRRKVVTGGRST